MRKTIWESLREMHQLDEEIEMHDELNPKIWDLNNELLPDVKSKILDIVAQFVDEVKDLGIDFHPVDTRIVGSNANYNYNDDSDLDIHIIVDPKNDCDKHHLEIIYDLYRSSFNNSYDISINGINAEIYVEKYDQAPHSNGIYSFTDGWIAEPDKFEAPEIDEKAVNSLVNKWVKEYHNIVGDDALREAYRYFGVLIESETNLKSVQKLIDDIYNARTSGLAEDGEFSIQNLAFKEFRRLGYLDKLKELRNKYQGQELSL